MGEITQILTRLGHDELAIARLATPFMSCYGLRYSLMAANPLGLELHSPLAQHVI